MPAPVKRLLALLPLIVAACTAQVTHPTKSLAEQQVDIDQCTHDANRKYWMDPVAALLHAYDCLEARGYQRVNKTLQAQVQQSVGPTAPRPPRPADASPPPPRQSPAAKPGSAEPCRVPCGTGG
ncbi:MAG TPA: hypothetical protein VKI45_04900, partial [Allosphingosinicella sp.]|nr:hypothetical protein [Allosphingosinicella sp.]